MEKKEKKDLETFEANSPTQTALKRLCVSDRFKAYCGFCGPSDTNSM